MRLNTKKKKNYRLTLSIFNIKIKNYKPLKLSYLHGCIYHSTFFID